jgi:hypothetical protein
MGKTGRLYSPKDSVRLVTKVLVGSLVFPRLSFLRFPPSWNWMYQ